MHHFGRWVDTVQAIAGVVRTAVLSVRLSQTVSFEVQGLNQKYPKTWVNWMGSNMFDRRDPFWERHRNWLRQRREHERL